MLVRTGCLSDRSIDQLVHGHRITKGDGSVDGRPRAATVGIELAARLSLYLGLAIHVRKDFDRRPVRLQPAESCRRNHEEHKKRENEEKMLQHLRQSVLKNR